MAGQQKWRPHFLIWVCMYNGDNYRKAVNIVCKYEIKMDSLVGNTGLGKKENTEGTNLVSIYGLLYHWWRFSAETKGYELWKIILIRRGGG